VQFSKASFNYYYIKIRDTYGKILICKMAGMRGKIREFPGQNGILDRCGVTRNGVEVLLSETRSRAGFLKCSQKITLDPNTAHRQLRLSEGNRKVTRMRHNLYHSLRVIFTEWSQVLSRESLTGRCYWEVEVGGEELVYLRECGFGLNNKSWMLFCSPNSYTFYHNNIKSPVSGPQSSRIGVYVDHTAGILSFYSVSETMTLLHRVNTTFTEPLHAGVWPILLSRINVHAMREK
uniref:SPRY-associated domain-containing protein n=1 Tax=Gouania willdenowi TaxID=441366 RepID=A0A8C5D950_GOUWI